MKRKPSTHAGCRPCNPKKPRRVADQSPAATPATVDHPVLSRLYADVLSLRHYLLSRLPASSRPTATLRRLHHLPHQPESTAKDKDPDPELDALLDQTLVGLLPNLDLTSEPTHKHPDTERHQDLEAFTQQLSASTNSPASEATGHFLQAEVSLTAAPLCPELTDLQIVDFVIWRLFRRSNLHRPAHLLCHGFQRSGALPQPGSQKTAHSIPGLSSCCRNTSVQVLKSRPWCRLHAILGKQAGPIIIDMLNDCALFSPVTENNGNGNFVQLSGIPICDLKPLHALSNAPSLAPTHVLPAKIPTRLVSEDRKPNAITFVRNRMLYARAAVNAKGGVRFGMRHIRE